MAASFIPSGGRAKTRAKGPKKKAVATQGRAPPPPPPAVNEPINPIESTGARNVLDERLESYHVDPTYSELLEENTVDLSALRDDFEPGMQPQAEP